MKKDYELYWDCFIDPETFMQSPIEPFNNPIRVMIAEESKIGSSVLDVGCASCISYPLFEGKKDYVGIDFTLQLLNVAKKKYLHVPLVHGDAKHLPFRDGSFDTVYIKDVLEHVGPDAYKTIISEMWRVAKMQVLIAFFGGIDRPTSEFKIGIQYEGHPELGLYYFNKYSRKDLSDFISQLPNLHNFDIIEKVPLENSTACARTLIIVRKQAMHGEIG